MITVLRVTERSVQFSGLRSGKIARGWQAAFSAFQGSSRVRWMDRMRLIYKLGKYYGTEGTTKEVHGLLIIRPQVPASMLLVTTMCRYYCWQKFGAGGNGIIRDQGFARRVLP